MRKVVVLGSTGSVGKSSLEVIEKNNDKYEIACLVAFSNEDLIQAQAKRHKKAKIYVEKPRDKLSTKKIINKNDLLKLISSKDIDTVIAAISGSDGLELIHHSILSGKKVLIANKEPLVMAGEFIVNEAEKHGAQIIPIDSEHCAIHQCLKNIEREDLNRIIITCSGGPFLGKKITNFNEVSVEDALNHPVWKMGTKNLIDSASLMNKALEIIEAKWLFDLKSEQIDVIIHPQSIIHSMVETKDNSILSVMSEPDMKICIAYGLGFPRKIKSLSKPLSLIENNLLEFINIDQIDFPSIKFARDALTSGGLMPAVLNAANEIAVEKFINNEIKFDLIFDTIKHVMEKFDKENSKIDPSLEQILEANEKARLFSLNYIKKI